ncbi:rRNA maturation RNase YbeY [Odoribacter lunatus]|uniref:rRNA maturation RNase YbeY n=1 Tax=Odoribacter lunatus TaxID=2941335 RepID=UPI00203A969E|nr:rRNA maturation RNase YbeY [Odoribacter lunatus]
MREVLFYEEGVELPSFFSEYVVNRWLDAIASHYSKEVGAISFIFCSDDYIIDVNRKYLNHDYYTDVITFDYCDNRILSGDVFISLDTVRSNAVLFNVDFESEFHRVICHSILHLIGFKDKTDPDSVLMRKNENICLDLLKTV